MDYDNLDWQKFKDGVMIYPLYDKKEGSSHAALLKYFPGASVQEHFHHGYEYLFILEGSQEDHHRVYKKGDFVVNLPGSSHWVKSETGCVLLAIWEKPVEFI